MNQDEAIRAQEARIEREIADRSLLISRRLPLDSLLSEYSFEDHVYRSKIADLKSVYGTMRRSRPDGNCFFRAFAFSLLDSLIGDVPEIDRLTRVGKQVQADLRSLGFSFTVDDFAEVFLETLADLRSGVIADSDQLLDSVLNDASRSDYLVVFLRLITSAHLQSRADFFQAFIEDGLSVKEFCAHEVEPMYKESDHIHVIAITSATGVGVRINYLDRGGRADKINVHDFPEGISQPKIHLLYRPGHYDVLYPRSPAEQQQQPQQPQEDGLLLTPAPGKQADQLTNAAAAPAASLAGSNGSSTAGGSSSSPVVVVASESAESCVTSSSPPPLQPHVLNGGSSSSSNGGNGGSSHANLILASAAAAAAAASSQGSRSTAAALSSQQQPLVGGSNSHLVSSSSAAPSSSSSLVSSCSSSSSSAEASSAEAVGVSSSKNPRLEPQQPLPPPPSSLASVSSSGLSSESLPSGSTAAGEDSNEPSTTS